jgi:hypothetical protein
MLRELRQVGCGEADRGLVVVVSMVAVYVYR